MKRESGLPGGGARGKPAPRRRHCLAGPARSPSRRRPMTEAAAHSFIQRLRDVISDLSLKAACEFREGWLKRVGPNRFRIESSGAIEMRICIRPPGSAGDSVFVSTTGNWSPWRIVSKASDTACSSLPGSTPSATERTDGHPSSASSVSKRCGRFVPIARRKICVQRVQQQAIDHGSIERRVRQPVGQPMHRLRGTLARAWICLRSTVAIEPFIAALIRRAAGRNLRAIFRRVRCRSRNGLRENTRVPRKRTNAIRPGASFGRFRRGLGNLPSNR